METIKIITDGADNDPLKTIGLLLNRFKGQPIEISISTLTEEPKQEAKAWEDLGDQAFLNSYAPEDAVYDDYPLDKLKSFPQ